MRLHADWLTQADERILEFLTEKGNHPPSAIAENISKMGSEVNYNSMYIGNRCRKLANAGILLNVGGGTYSITEDGERFLDGDLDAGDLPEPSE